MKNFSLQILFVFVTLLINANSYAGTKWSSYLKWPTDRVNDQVQILPFGHEIKLNYFLKKVHEELGISLNFEIIESLNGKDIETLANDFMQKASSVPSSVYFILSLSDRQFKVHPHPAIQEKLGPEVLDHLIRVTIPIFKKQKYSLGIQIFLQNLVYEVNPQSSLIVPNLSDRKNKSLNNFFFFLSCALFILILGHKIRLSSHYLFKSDDLKDSSKKSLGVFW